MNEISGYKSFHCIVFPFFRRDQWNYHILSDGRYIYILLKTWYLYKLTLVKIVSSVRLRYPKYTRLDCHRRTVQTFFYFIQVTLLLIELIFGDIHFTFVFVKTPLILFSLSVISKVFRVRS